MNKSYTEGGVVRNLLRFSVPYLISCFLQTFYGLADLFVIGQFNGASTITAVSVGSQVMHMVTVIIVGLAMGTTVTIGRAVGAKNTAAIKRIIGNTVTVFTVFAVFATVVLLCCTNGILSLLSVPDEALEETKRYLSVCFAGVAFITAYNVLSSIFRGMGDSKTPMIFVAISGVINIGIDYLFIGTLSMGAQGAALATVIAQALSVVMALAYILLKCPSLRIKRRDLKIYRPIMRDILKIGIPISAQDGLIQIAFLVITVIANRRGVDAAAAVGIVEKLICFMFLVPSAMLSSVSTIAAQNVGAGMHERADRTLFCAMGISVFTGLTFSLICCLFAPRIISVFAKGEYNVIIMGAQYLRSYVFDCVFAAIHFCFSGYFCAYKKSYLSFAHNIASIVFIRIPGAYLASRLFADTLFPMGMAAPMGSLLSALICAGAYIAIKKKV